MNQFPAAPIEHVEDSEYVEDAGAAASPSIDFLALLWGVLQRWRLIAAITLGTLLATYGVARLLPSRYTSTVGILVFDPQGQIDPAVLQKPVSPFVDALNSDAMYTEINIIKSKSVALRVANELGLDRDPEFQHNQFAEMAERLGFPGLSRALDDSSTPATGGPDAAKAEKLDQAADALLKKMQVSADSYIISLGVTAQDPARARRLAAAIADDYLASQREARQEALQRVATWLKSRVDDLQSRVLETETAIENLKAAKGIREPESGNIREQQISALNTQLATVRADVDQKRGRLEQARHMIDNNADFQGLTSPPFDSSLISRLRQRQAEMSWRVADLQKRLGEHHAGVIALRSELAGINQQINAEVQHILSNIQNAYEVSLRQQQALEADLQRLTGGNDWEAYQKLQQLQRLANADRNLHQSYLSQYNDISQRRTLQDASARIISPASLPRSPDTSRRKLYALGGMLGLGGGFLLALLLEYRPGVKTGTEIEQSFGRRVLGIIPLVRQGKVRSVPYAPLLRRIVDEPLSQFSEAVNAVRISLDLSNAKPKVILVTSALRAEGKSTAAMLLAASSAGTGKRTILLDCDLRQQSTSMALRKRRGPGLSELLRGTAELAQVVTKDPVTQAYVVPAGSMVPNAADLLMSQRMRDLIAALRTEYDYIVMDTTPLLPVIDALVLASVADRVVVIVEWSQTPRAAISEAFKVLRPEAHRIAGIVLNKVDLTQMHRYGYREGYYYPSAEEPEEEEPNEPEPPKRIGNRWI